MNAGLDSNPSPEEKLPVSPRVPVRRRIKWFAMGCCLCAPLALICLMIGSVIGARTENPVALALTLALWLTIAVAIDRWGRRCAWDTSTRIGIGKVVLIFVVPVGVILLFGNSVGNVLPRKPAIDKAVLNNIRQLAAAADQYFQEHAVTVCLQRDLVGPDKYVKALNTVAHESYPQVFAKGAVITVTGVANARTITYAP